MIKVEDIGIGIAVEHQQRIFDRFYRVDRDRFRTSGGSGLGLAIAIAIARAHKGNIHVQSQPGLGSTFTVQLPFSS
ncbi:ATP-binding protein [Nostoc punctiforme]|uniref:ATP-binding protein n=1 Tax=Nostoc punctiforme TaxID=272131 RepID=UPI000045BAD9|nr:ATP-binding protein [Nostoc punctiforme]